MNIINEWLDHGRETNNPTRIVIHSMGEFIRDDKVYSARDFLDKLGLSAHVLIKPDGDIIRCRRDDQGAYHAREYNTDSLGIEFLVKGSHNYASFLEAIKTDYVTPEQYASGIEVVDIMINAHPIRSIDRHSDLSPGRKTDPGAGFKWQWFNNQLDSFFII